MTTRNQGFTLIEILVVITIIAALMGLGFALFDKSQSAKAELMTQQRISAIDGALKTLAQPTLMGGFPPADYSHMRGLKGEPIGGQLGMPNDTNLGIESVYVALFLMGHNISIDMEDDWLANLDGDMMSANITRTQSSELMEFVDYWKNPLAYFSQRELKNYDAVKNYITLMGPVEVRPHVSEKLGTPMNQGSFQLFSAGPDGLFNTKDDIKNW